MPKRLITFVIYKVKRSPISSSITRNVDFLLHFYFKLKMITYIIKDKVTGFYKIGRTKNLKSRFNTLSTGNLNLEIILTFPGDIEKILHVQFAANRIQREWFFLSTRDLISLNELVEEYLKDEL